jgi:hypothetical protein
VKYGTATTPLPSLTAGGGDEEDTGAGAGAKAADVQDRALVLVPVAEAIRGYEQHHGFRGAWRAATWQQMPRSQQ